MQGAGASGVDLGSECMRATRFMTLGRCAHAMNITDTHFCCEWMITESDCRLCPKQWKVRHDWWFLLQCTVDPFFCLFSLSYIISFTGTRLQLQACDMWLDRRTSRWPRIFWQGAASRIHHHLHKWIPRQHRSGFPSFFLVFFFFFFSLSLLLMLHHSRLRTGICSNQESKVVDPLVKNIFFSKHVTRSFFRQRCSCLTSLLYVENMKTLIILPKDGRRPRSDRRAVVGQPYNSLQQHRYWLQCFRYDNMCVVCVCG